MTKEQAFTALGWFRYKEDESGHCAIDINAVEALLDVFKDSDETVPNWDYTYREYYNHYIEHYMPYFKESL